MKKDKDIDGKESPYDNSNNMESTIDFFNKRWEKLAANKKKNEEVLPVDK